MTNKEIKDLMQDFDNSSLAYIKITNGDFTVKMKKATLAPAAPPQPVAVQQIAQPIVAQATNVPVATASKKGVKAPLVGVFYKAPAPDVAPFVKIGDKVAIGDVVCLIEAMKMINEIKSTVAGTVSAILVEDGELVSFDEIVIEIEE